MARIRSIKPETFTNEDLAACSPHARIAFPGLWCHADREGRLEDRPRRLAMVILPYDRAVDFDALLAELAAAGFVVRYEVNGAHYVQIVNFSKHQHPHPNETVSIIPPPPGGGSAKRQGVKRSGKGGQRVPPEHVALGQEGKGREGSRIGREQEGNGSARADDARPALLPDPNPADTPDALAALWNELADPLFSRVTSLEGGRRKHASAALAAHPLAEWRQAILPRVNASAFLRGELSRDGAHEGWRADFDYLIRPAGRKPATLTLLLEGRFDNGTREAGRVSRKLEACRPGLTRFMAGGT